MIVNDLKVHERRVIGTFSSRDIKEMIIAQICREYGIHEPFESSVRFEDETEGSPAYTVGTKAIVAIIKKL